MSRHLYVLDHDGLEEWNFQIAHVELCVSWTGCREQGRRLMRVECLSCDHLVTPATTRVRIRVEDHLRVHHTVHPFDLAQFAKMAHMERETG